ncbi:MAG: redoxin domain-containing protein [Thermoplasmatales archaeon]|nr:MAG: redoxin domain-containing protein [Thermoplasmatales archaeon]
MTKKNEDKNILIECPVCKSPIMSKNLPRHLSKVHFINSTNDKTDEEEMDERINPEDEIYLIRDELKTHRRQRNIASILFVAMLVLVPVTYAITAPTEVISTSQSSNQNSQSSNSNQELVLAPDFSSLEVVTGETFLLSQLKGSTVVLNFVNYGCNAKTNEIVSDQLLDIKSLRAQRDDFIPVSVFCGCCPIETLRDFAVENELTWPWILDSDYSIIQEYVDYVGEYGYPTLIFIDKYQNIVDYSGYSDVSTLSTMIDGML